MPDETASYGTPFDFIAFFGYFRFELGTIYLVSETDHKKPKSLPFLI